MAKTPPISNLPTAADAGLQPCPTCDTSGFVPEMLVPKRILDNSEREREEARKETIKVVMILVVIFGGLALAAWPVTEAVERYLRSERDDKAAQQAFEDKKKDDLEKARKEHQQRWEACLLKTGIDKCRCMEAVDDSADTSRCWRDAALLQSTRNP